MQTPAGLYPEYYLLKINNFNDIAKDGLDEWIYFLKNESIRPEFSARVWPKPTNNWIFSS